ncbi:hypothetical protein NDU88_007499 [Pleurodeles waltl]|uniref:Uncharacterized protein n=1 Tax=Pleurodeles waltl TaxID=8319 RepID=A0AAV7U075_PLEWA|nr:hypothetical protein NDU88_007499 [Pleurodeles waltl]
MVQAPSAGVNGRRFLFHAACRVWPLGRHSIKPHFSNVRSPLPGLVPQEERMRPQRVPVSYWSSLPASQAVLMADRPSMHHILGNYRSEKEDGDLAER